MKIAQSFFSVQGEGISTGVPSYFVRFAGCNLSCGMSPKSVSALKRYLDDNPDVSGSSDLDREYGDLLKTAKATWVCDTISVWLNGEDTTNQELKHRMYHAGVWHRILNGAVHIIWTGGEPTMIHHRQSIEGFLNYLVELNQAACVYSEIETNGTIVVPSEFYEHFIQQINCSPKLTNSGMPRDKRINPSAMVQIMRHHNSWFKFVISIEEDIDEIQRDFLIPFRIPDNRVIIMPGVDSRDQLGERTEFLYSMTKKYGYRGITRGHVLAWDKVTGV